MMDICKECGKQRRHKWDDFLNRFVCIVCQRNGKPGYDKPVMYFNYEFLNKGS